MKNLKTSLLIPALLFCCLAFSGMVRADNPAKDQADTTGNTVALETMVVSGTKTEVSLDKSAKSINVIDGKEMTDYQQYFLPELIDNQPGVYLNRSGGLGQYSTISIRGAGTQHTQFQYNGMPLRDAADTQCAFQYFIEDMFGADNVDRVEVLKGTNSTLHGSQAMGGVINIIPKKTVEGFSGSFRNEFGPDSTYLGHGNLAYGKNSFYLDLNPSYITTDGEDYGGSESYFYDQKGFALGSGFSPTDSTEIQLTAIYSDSDLGLGKSPSLDSNGNLVSQQATKDKHRESKMAQVGLNWLQQVTDSWDYTLKGSYGETERHYFWTATQGDKSNYDGETSFLEMQHNINLLSWLGLTLGMDWEEQVYDGQEPRNKNSGDYTPVYYDETWESWDGFGLLRGTFMDEAFLVNLGARFNDHDKFGGKTVWEASTAYILKSSDTKFHAHVGTGYRTPSLYETYGGYLSNGNLITIGNQDLVPEESIGWEAGVEQHLFDRKLALGLTYFYTEYDDLIIYDIDQYQNANEAENKGVEAFVTVQPRDSVKISLAYTHMESRYKETASATKWTRKEYLPEDMVDLTMVWKPTEKLTLSGDISWQGEKIVPLYDSSYNKIRWEEDDSITMDLAANYQLFDWVSLFARADNLFDRDYTESGYQMPGMTVQGGFKLIF